MKRFKSFKKKKNNYTLFILTIIIIITLTFLRYFDKKISSNMLDVSKIVTNDVILNIVNKNIKPNVFKNYSINDLIEIEYNNNKISDINYNLEKSYELLMNVKSEINDNIKSNIVNFDNVEFRKDYLLINIPFYSYTDNLLVSHFGPNVKTKINVIHSVDGSVNTKVKSYGINSLLIELYLNINVISSAIVPFNQELINNNYNILICSKIIQGEIPSIYNGVYEKEGNNLKI